MSEALVALLKDLKTALLRRSSNSLLLDEVLRYFHNCSPLELAGETFKQGIASDLIDLERLFCEVCFEGVIKHKGDDKGSSSSDKPWWLGRSKDVHEIGFYGLIILVLAYL